MKKCFLIGYVGQDPQIRLTKDGREFATFSIGIRENKANTVWVNALTTSEKLIKVIKSYVRKGSHISLIGSLAAPNAYKDKQEQIKATNVVYIVEIELLDKKNNETTKESSETYYDLPEYPDTAPDSDIPF